MKLSCSQTELKKTLAFLMRGTRSKDIVPLELSLVGDQLTLSCTDGTLYARATIPCVGKKDGVVRVDGTFFTTCIKSLPGKVITIGGEKRLRLAHGKRIRHIPVLSDDYAVVIPKVNDTLEIKFDMDDLINGMSVVKPSIGEDKGRIILNNFYFCAELNAVIACDGLSSAFYMLDKELGTSFTLPVSVMDTLKAMTKLNVKTVTIRGALDSWVEIDGGDYIIRAATIAGTYPADALIAMSNTIPNQPNGTVGYLPKAEWLSVLRLAQDYATQAAKQSLSEMLTIRMLDDNIQFSMQVTNVGELNDILPAKIIGPPTEIGVHPMLLLRALSGCPINETDDSLSISVWNPARPYMMQSEGWMYLAAPMVGPAAAASQAQEKAARLRESEPEPPPWDDSDGDF